MTRARWFCSLCGALTAAPAVNQGRYYCRAHSHFAAQHFGEVRRRCIHGRGQATGDNRNKHHNGGQCHDCRIQTQIEPASTFWEAEDYHQQYLEKRGRAACHRGLAA